MAQPMLQIATVDGVRTKGYVLNTSRDLELRQKCDQRLNLLDTDRLSWWVHWRDLSRYIQPRLGRFLETPNQGNRGSPKNQRILDETGSISAQRFGAGMMAGVASPARPWFKLRIGSINFAEGSPTKLWLDEVEKRMRTIFAESNFYRSMATLFEEIGVFGTAVIVIYEDFDDIIRCFPMAAGEYYIGNDHRLEPVTLGRRIVMTVAEMVGRFGIDACSEKIQMAYRAGRHGDEVLIDHLIMRNDKRVWNAEGAEGAPWFEVYWEHGSSGNSLLQIKGFQEKPFIAARWNVTSNDAYGRSPGMDALGSIKQLQLQTKRQGQLIDKLVNPPMTAPAAMQNMPASLVPGAITYLPTGVGAEAAFKPSYEVKPEALPAINNNLQDVRNRIKSTFFEDLFLMISQLDTVRTATEIAERKEEKMLMLGPALERLHDEALRIAVVRLYGIMRRKNLLPQAPAEIAGKALSAEFVSTLAQAQKAVATTAIERLFAFAGSISADRPEVLDKLDTDVAIDQYADALGAPAAIVVSSKRVAEIRAARAKQQQAQTTLQSGLAAAQGGKVLSETDVGGGQNALAKMLGQAA